MQFNIFLTSILIGLSLSLSGQIGINYIEDHENNEDLIFFSTVSDDSYLTTKCGEIIRHWNHSNVAGLSGRLTHDGKLLRAQLVNGSFPQASTGGLLELYDLETNLEWSYSFSNSEYTQHHDFHYMDNGNILFIGWEFITDDEKEALGKENAFGSLWGEFIYEIKPIGTEEFELVWEWHLKDHLVQDVDSSKDNFVKMDTAIGKVDINYRGPTIFSNRDWWHCNAIHYNKDRDEILLSTRSNCEVWILDHSTTSDEAKTDQGGQRGKGGQILFRWGNPESYQRGNSSDLKLYGAHGHHWIDENLPNTGKILFFNNGDERPEGYYSTIEMIEPAYDADGNYIIEDYIHQLTHHEVIYGENQSNEPLRSTYLSNAQQLDNGNFLINEGNQGRVFEIDDNNEIVWELNSNRDIFRAYSYKLDYDGFSNLDKTNFGQGPEPQMINASQGESITLNVPGATIRWYETENSTNSIWLGNNYTLSNIQENKTVWVESGEIIAGSQLCVSDRVPIEVIVTGTSTSNIDKSTIDLYPNPTTESFTLKSEQQIDQIKILSLNGVEQITRQIGQAAYDVSSLSPGLYFIELMINNQTLIKKLIVE